jgi:ATP-dependent DNA helicase RecQ
LRALQEQAVAAAMEPRDSLLVMPTGGGKSLCYQLPPLIDDRLDVVVSPLISLMKDQVDGLREVGVPAAALHSGISADERNEINAMIRAGELRLLFTSPERLVTDGFLSMLEKLDVRRFAIDEAHCISQWGHDFRPEYRQLAMLRERFPGATLHAFTATATPRVRDDIVRQLALVDPAVMVGSVDRDNLVYRVVPKVDVERQTAEVIARHPDDAVIVYCISRKETESLAGWLTHHAIPAKAYHAGMDGGLRRQVQEEFASEKLNVVVATVAFGMGIDRSNVRCVIHTGMPKSVEHYQQETGRAGRDGLEAECVLLYSAGDAIKWERIIEMSAADAPDPEAWLAASKQLLQGMSRFAINFLSSMSNHL